MSDIGDDLIALIGLLPDRIKNEIFKILYKLLDYREVILEWGPDACSWFANMFGHQFVWALKRGGKDTTAARTQVRDRLVKAFMLPDDWMPKWPLEQPV